MNENLDLFEKVINKTIPKVDYVDIRGGNGNNTSIIMKDGEVQEINTGNSLGIRIRVLNNGAWGFAYTNDLSKLDEIAQTSIKISNSLKGDESLSKADIIQDKVSTDVKIPFSDVSIEEKKEIMSEASKAASLKEVTSTTVSYSDSQSQEVILSSEGTSIEMNTNRVAMFLNAAASDGTMMQIGHNSIGGVKGFEAISDEDIEAFGRKIGERL